MVEPAGGFNPAISIELEDGTVNGFPVTEAVLFAEGVPFTPGLFFGNGSFPMEAQTCCGFLPA